MSTKAQRAWYLLNRERIAAARAKKHVPFSKLRRCDICNTEFTARGKASTKKRCSNKCKQEGLKQIQKRFSASSKGKALHARHAASDKRKIYVRDWRIKRREKLNMQYRLYAEAVPEVKLYRVLRATLNNRIGVGCSRTSLYVPYSSTQLRHHLEGLFKPGMSWKNYGRRGWHIDHIKALSTFKFFTEHGKLKIVEVRKAMALSNLQPLWAKDNISKGGINRFGNPTVCQPVMGGE